MSPLLSDDHLTKLLSRAGQAYEVPAVGADEVLAAVGPPPKRSLVARRRVLQLTAVITVLLLGFAVVRNGGGGSSSYDRASTAGGTVATSTAGQSSAGSGRATGSRQGGAQSPGTAGSVPPPLGAPATTELRSTTGGGPAAPAAGAAPGPADGARIIKTGTVVLVAPNGKVSAVLGEVTRVVATARGYLASSSSEEAGSSPTGTMTLRVPAPSYEAVVRQVRAIGAQVVSVSSSGNDVTATYADVAAQIGSLTAARNRFLVILGQAKTIGETLAVQQRVDDVQSQIDRLQGQRRVLADQSDFATLTVTVSEAGSNDIAVTPRSGLSKAWHDAVNGFTSGIEAIIARSGRTLVVVLFLGVLLVLGRLGWRFARRAAL